MAKDRITLKPGLSCIGEVCFDEDGGITVRLSKDANPECAVLTAKTISGGKPVRFEVAPGQVKK